MKRTYYKIWDDYEKTYVNMQDGSELRFSTDTAADTYIWNHLSDYYMDKPISVFIIKKF